MRLRRICSALGLVFLAQCLTWGQHAETLQAPKLIAPSEHASIPQNVESTLCSKSSVGGFGYSIEFAWSPVAGATRYELFVQHNPSSAPALDRVTQQLSYEHQQCGAFVIDANLTQWEWRVRPLPESGEPGPWSETRHFDFAPCRLLDGTPCSAPAEPTSTAAKNGTRAQPDSDGVYRIGGDVSAPAIAEKVEPDYTEEARSACSSGSVLLSLVIDARGIPRDIRVIRPLGLGLDEKAVEAVSKWRFRPGLKSGQPVAVQARVEVNFRILCKKI
ncbi:MAG: energy transducer TonB [Acidobacteriaceae bacterium]|nr:energy transducer TonB [Acidobacteriaceae bacterium]MBV9780968.1 energy transducer TonB [Acidobacteriaceae bacterium]